MTQINSTTLADGGHSHISSPALIRPESIGTVASSQSLRPLTYGSVTVTDFGEVKLHSYQSPDLTGCVTTHIIETPERLVFFDGQRSVIFGQEIRSYGEALGKPIDRMVISHLHPDHWFGAYQFQDVPIYSFPETQAEINELGDFFIKISLASLGQHVPPSKVVPTRTVAHDSIEVIDGVRFEYRYVKDAEADHMLAIYLPDQKVYIAQDLLYNHCHLFCGHGNFDGWIASLKGMRQEAGFDLILPGHGSNDGSRQAIDDAIIYLEYVERQLASVKDGAALKAAILERYPSYLAASLVDIQNLFLFPEK